VKLVSATWDKSRIVVDLSENVRFFFFLENDKCSEERGLSERLRYKGFYKLVDIYR